MNRWKNTIGLLLAAGVWSCTSPGHQEYGKMPDGVISDVTAAPHPMVSTVLTVSWKQIEPADNAWLRFTFENDEYFESMPKTAVAGDHTDVILGVPSETVVTFPIINDNGGVKLES